jgi:hypothetical protein
MKRYLLLIIFISVSVSFSNIYADETVSDKTPASGLSQLKLIPDISFIMDFSAVYRNMDDEKYRNTEIAGFNHSASEEAESGHDHTGMNANRGFNFNYGELVLSSAVDPYLDLSATFHLSEEGFEIEEAFANTKALPCGIQVKLGKFLSGFGRINGQHSHSWSFSDQPVVYKSFFGQHGLLEKGVQASWTAPLDFYLVLGAESLQGENESSFGHDGFSNNAVEVKDVNGPGIYTGFIKTSFDIGKLAVLAGGSCAMGKTRLDHGLADDEGHAVSGDAGVYGGELVFKYIIDSYRYISLEGEYLYRDLNGDLYRADAGGTTESVLEKKQSGYYGQVVIKPFMNWRFGLRQEMLMKNDIKIAGIMQDTEKNLQKYSAMLEYNPSEFSRIRLQYNYDKTVFIEEKEEPVHEVILQFNLAIGAHGAHSF